MRRLKKVALISAFALMLTACGSSSTDNASTKADANVTTVDGQNSVEDSEEIKVQKSFIPSTSGAYATIKVSSAIKMEENAWVGLCPMGTDYIQEEAADEVDQIYYYAEQREKDDDPYVFACDFSDMEDGKYAVVVCTSDDADKGYVAIQLAMEKKGDKLTFDYTDAKLREQPKK